MSTGLGFFDAQGVWMFGEDDSETLMSDLLNKGQSATSDALVADRSRLANLEAGALVERSQITSAASTTPGNSGTLYWAQVTITFDDVYANPPLVDVSTPSGVIWTQLVSVTATTVTFRGVRVNAALGTLSWTVQTVGVLA